MKKRFWLIAALAAAAVFLLFLFITPKSPVVSGGVKEIPKYGNLNLDIPAASLTEAGIAYGDILEIRIDGKKYSAPFCVNYTDVDSGLIVLCDRDGTLVLAINAGDFASTYQIASKSRDEEGNIYWTLPEERALSDISVSIRLKEKGGYREEYLVHQLVRTYERSDYESDAVYANFRSVTGDQMGENVLYRSSSPIDPTIGRAFYANLLTEKSQIRTVLNLADSDAEIRKFMESEDFTSAYYRGLWEEGNVKALAMGMDFYGEDFQSALAEGVRFMIAHDGPYLLHCTEGKDRTGFSCALLAAFMGADYEELVEDYMRSYECFYHLEKGSEQYEAIRRKNIDGILCTLADRKDPSELGEVDFSAVAQKYLKEIGLSEEECEILYKKLANHGS